MIIGDRLRSLRAEKKLSQGDMKKRTGLFGSYVSRVENGHTVPSIETLEKMARALEVPMYEFFYDGDEPPDRKSTRLNSSHGYISYAVFCLKKKNKIENNSLIYDTN